MGKRKKPEIDDQIIIYKKTGYFISKETGKKTSYPYYQACWEVPKASLPEGASRRRITASGPSKSKAIADVREKVYGFLDSPEAHWGSVRTRGVSLDRYVERWIREELPSDPMSETMKRRHIEFYRHHISPSLGAKNIRNITTSEINRLLHHTLTLPRDIPSKIYKSGVRENVTLSSATRKNVYSTLSKIFTQATNDGVVVKNPMKGVNKVEVTSLKKENIELAIIDVNKTMKWIRKNAPEDFCQYGLQFLGLRRAERLGLTWDKIEGLDTKNPKIVVSQQLARYETPEYPYILRKKRAIANQGWYIKEWTKTKKHRTIPVPEEFAIMLREHRKRWKVEKKIWGGPARQDLEAQYETWLNTGKRGNPPEMEPPYDLGNLLFLHEDGSIITLNNDNEGWKKYLNLAGARQWRGHLNRHITATIFANLANPPSVQEMQDMLGHETTAMALYYARIRERNLKSTLADYGKSLGFF